MESVVENKNAPGNGLTGSGIVAPEEEKVKTKDNKEKPKVPKKPQGIVVKNSKNTEKDVNDSKETEKLKIDDNTNIDDEDPGPSVSDNESESEKRRRQRGKDTLGIWAHKAQLTPKKGLIYLLFCFAFLLVLLFVIFLMAALWPKGLDYDVCETSTCFRYSTKILGGLNNTVGVCEDYWEHSCGGWLKEHPLPKSQPYWDAKTQEILNVKEKIRSLLNTLPMRESDEPNSVPLKMKRFYDSCMGVDYVDADKEKDLLRVIKSLGGWNVLRDFRASDFDFPRLLRKLQGEFRIHPFFRIEVVPDPSVPSKNIIKISPSGLSLPHRDYYFEQNEPMAAAFQTFAKEVVQNLGGNSYQSAQFAVEIFNFERRIAEVTPDPKNLTDPVMTFQKVTVAQLKAMSNTIFWADLLKGMFPQGSINDMTEVLTPSVQYLMDISGVISTTDKGNLNNYLIWHLTQKYLPYMSKHFTESLEMFRKETVGTSASTARWEFCVAETMRFFPQGCDNLLYENRMDAYLLKHPSGTSGRIDTRATAITDMFERMRTVLIDRVNEAIKYDESIRNFKLDKLRLMTIQVGNPIKNQSLLEEIYFQVHMQKFEFFANVQGMTEFKTRIEQKGFVHASKDTTIVNVFAEKPFDIQFLPSLNKIIVPESVLHRQVLDVADEVLSLLYGSIGVEIGEAMASAFGPEKGLYLSNGAILPERDPKVQELRDLINSRRTCLSSFFTNIRLDDESYITQTATTTTIHLAGIQIALDTLITHDLSSNFLSLPGLDFDSRGLFFLAYSQSQCSVHTMLFHDLEHRTFTTLSHEHRVRGLLRQMVAFTESFKCSKSSEMYADFSCGYIL